MESSAFRLTRNGKRTPRIPNNDGPWEKRSGVWLENRKNKNFFVHIRTQYYQLEEVEMQEDASSQQEKRIKQRDMVAPRPVRVLRPEVGTETKARATVLLLKANPQGAMSAQEGLRIEQEINQIKSV